MPEIMLIDAVFPMKNGKNELFHKWEFIITANTALEHRIYFKPDTNGNGFKYVAVIETSNNINHKKWDLRSQEVDIIFYGIATFDGVRHHYNGFDIEDSESYGYWNYPDIECIIETFQVLRNLEKKYCRDHA